MTKISHDSETKAEGQQVISVTAFIHKRTPEGIKVFLPRRAKTKKFLPDLWEMPGGHVDFGEDIVAALKREVVEEFNMKIEVGDPFACFTYINNVKGSHSIEVVYFAKFSSAEEEIVVNPEDHSEFKWFTKQEVLKEVSPMREIKRLANSVSGTTGDDLEIRSILRGFDILEGNPLNYGSMLQ